MVLENIYQKLARVRKAVEVIQKNKEGYGYRYVTEDEILARITVYMDKLGLSLIPGVVPGTTQVAPYSYKKTKFVKGSGPMEETVNEILVQADMTWTWVNNETPEEHITVPWVFVGQQSDASQAFGSGLTYAERYFLLKYFNIATPDADPDAFRSKQKSVAAAENKAVADEIVNQIDVEVRSYLAANPDSKDTISDFMKVYVKSGNYLSITDPALAARLLADFQAKFNNEEKGDE